MMLTKIPSVFVNRRGLTVLFLVAMGILTASGYWKTTVIGLISVIAGVMTSVVGGGGVLTTPALLALGITVALTVGLSRVAFFPGPVSRCGNSDSG